jgi:hypothetical protein
MEIEEQSRAFPVPEVHRIHGCGVDTVHCSRNGAPIAFEVSFSLCRNVKRMLEYPSDDVSQHWISWEETLVVPRG